MYGAVTIYDAGWITQTVSAAGNPYLFTGRRFDPESGNYYYRARIYSPALGRFLSMDPLGVEAGDYNLYRYAFNNPANLTDPTGEFAFIPWLLSASAQAAADALMQVLFNYYFDPNITTVDQAFQSIDYGQVGMAFLTGLLPGGRWLRSLAGAAGDVILYVLDAQADCREPSLEEILSVFAFGLGAEVIGDYVGDAVAKYGTRAVAKGLRKLGLDELAEKVLRQLDEAAYKAFGDLVSSAQPGTGKAVGEIVGSAADAEGYFRSIVKPETIRPHPNVPGGFLGEGPDGLTVGYRPSSRSGPPTIDLGQHYKAGKSPWEKIKFK